MAVPKKKTSQTKRGMRRSGQHHKLYAKHPMVCTNCGSQALAHTVCSACGMYKGKQIFAIKESEEETTEE